jgi:poly-gamma-glutamate synthesis protein (capsule biosynthesis protein)
MDFMGNGMLDTRFSLNELGIRYTGSGNNIFEASEPVYFKKKDTTIGILSASDHYRWFGAEEKIAGIRYVDITQNGWWNIIKQIQNMKKNCDFIIFSLNWKMKINNVKWFARKLIDYGVNVVHGCFPHKILPLEKYKNGLIIYSGGNYIDDYNVTNNKNNLSYITDVYIDNGNIYCVKVRPTSRTLHQVNFAKGKDYIDVMKVANI